MLRRDLDARCNETAKGRAVRCYSWLLRVFYPAGFRRQVGSSAIELFADRYHAAVQDGRFFVVRLWIRTLLNVAIHGPLEHLSEWRQRRPLESWTHDLTSAFSSARRAWRVNVTIIFCVALGVGATSAILTLFSSVLIRSVPFPDAERLVRVWSIDDDAQRQDRDQLSVPDVRDIADQVTTIEPFEATIRSRLMFLSGHGARRVEGEAVTRGYFDVLDIDPYLGRLFAADEFTPSSEPVIALSYGTWVNDFGADSSIIGSTLRTANRNYVVVGILPPEFLGTLEDDIPDIEFWVPLTHDRSPAMHARRDLGLAWTLGRLRPGVTLQQANEEIRSIGVSLATTHPATRGTRGLRAELFGENWRSRVRTWNYVLLGAAGLLLAVAAANVAGLLLARSMNRRREYALRAALGAARGRLVQHAFAETVILTAVGGVIGVLAAPWILHAFLSLAPEEIPSYVTISLDYWALALSCACMGATALLAGAVPAWVASQVSPGAVLQSGARGSTSGRFDQTSSRVVVSCEVALTTVLLVTAAILMRTYHALTVTDTGFRTSDVVRLAIFIDTRDVEQQVSLPTFYNQLASTVASYPGVQSVGLSSPTVPPALGQDVRVNFQGIDDQFREYGLLVQSHAVDPGFLTTLDIPIITGRNILATDHAPTAHVTVVSRSLAELMGGIDQAIGRTVRVENDTFRVVGVAGDVMFYGPVRRRPRDLDMYTSLSQRPSRTVSLAVAVSSDPQAFIGPLRQRLNDLAPSSAFDWVGAVTSLVDEHLESPRFYLLLVGTFGLSALTLTAVGLFASLAFHVAQRRSQFGIRQALGANRMDVMRYVMSQGVLVIGVGLAFGLAVGWAISRTMSSRIPGLLHIEFTTLLATALVIAMPASVAVYLPAARAARISPLEVLRN